jgi:hypothetical protein
MSMKRSSPAVAPEPHTAKVQRGKVANANTLERSRFTGIDVD